MMGKFNLTLTISLNVSWRSNFLLGMQTWIIHKHIRSQRQWGYIDLNCCICFSSFCPRFRPAVKCLTWKRGEGATSCSSCSSGSYADTQGDILYHGHRMKVKYVIPKFWRQGADVLRRCNMVPAVPSLRRRRDHLRPLLRAWKRLERNLLHLQRWVRRRWTLLPTLMQGRLRAVGR